MQFQLYEFSVRLELLRLIGQVDFAQQCRKFVGLPDL